MIGILDYGMGNLGSVSLAFKRIGAKAKIISSGEELRNCGGLAIPGVGAFKPAMQRLDGMREEIRDFAESGKPVLGICLGMQVLFSQGTEGGASRGLELVEGNVRKMAFAPKLPHVGWNEVELKGNASVFKGIGNRAFFYFVHSYACFPASRDDVAGTTSFGKPFASATARGNVFGVQFHPERSGSTGERLLKNFAELV